MVMVVIEPRKGQAMTDGFNPRLGSAEYLRRSEDWYMTRALLRGTRAMREAGSKFLPKFQNETEEAWRRRLSVSVLHKGFGKIVRTMSSLPFGRDIILGPDVPEAIRGVASETGGAGVGGWIENIDNEGTHLSIFAHRVFRCGLAHGSAHILVDMPAAGQVDAADARPRWVFLPPWALLDARKQVIDGIRRYTYVRILEAVDGPDGPVEKVREIEPGEWRLWAQGKDGWKVEATGPYESDFVTMASFIPVQDDEADLRAVFTGPSPLENVAYLNICHWQSASDQRNILTFSRFALLVLKGVGGNDAIDVGPQSAIRLPADGGAELLEPAGTGIQSGERDLVALEQAMEREGLQLLVKRAGNITATEVTVDESKDRSDLQAMTLQFQDTLETALGYTAQWADLGDGGSVRLHLDFGVTQNAEAVARIVLDLRRMGDLSAEDALSELQRVGILAHSADVAALVARAREGAMLDIPPAPDDDEAA